jgi:hypothetical protein
MILSGYFNMDFSTEKSKTLIDLLKTTFQPKSQILIFILTYPDSLPIIIIYEISGKKTPNRV